MKLYTEEQVKQAIQMADKHHYLNESEDDSIIDTLTPIELPSDEEIEEKAFQVPFNNTNEFYDKSFIKGAKWVKKQILNQNK